jgi:cytochrome bd-type quinol oxidase subunit 2
MKKLFKQIAIVSMLTAVALLFTSVFAHAQGATGSGFFGPQGQSGSVPSAVIQATGGQGSVRQLILTFINYFLGFLGLLAVIMIIYAGVLYITDAGEGGNTDKAKKIIMYAVVGILIIFLSFAIVNFALGAGTGQEI